MARQRFDASRQDRWGWWWTPDLAADLGLEEDYWPEWTDDLPWDAEMMAAWYRDQELVPPKPPGAELTPEPVIEVPQVKRTSPGGRVNGAVAIETRDAGRRQRRMKRYMVWWRSKQAALRQGLPEPPRPAEGFGDTPERDDEPVH